MIETLALIGITAASCFWLGYAAGRRNAREDAFIAAFDDVLPARPWSRARPPLNPTQRAFLDSLNETPDD